jgi:hypothetical protein
VRPRPFVAASALVGEQAMLEDVRLGRGSRTVIELDALAPALGQFDHLGRLCDRPPLPPPPLVHLPLGSCGSLGLSASVTGSASDAAGSSSHG